LGLFLVHSKSELFMTHGVVAAGCEQTANAAVETLEAGGNAVDAAVAAAFATSAGEATLTSLMGGCVMAYRDGKSGEVVIGDCFANAPGLGAERPTVGAQPPPDFHDVQLAGLDFYGIDVDFGSAVQTFHIGRGSAAVPGTIGGLWEAWQKWGQLSDSQTLLGPAVRAIRQGITMTQAQAVAFSVLEPILLESELGRRAFFRADGRMKEAGDHFHIPELADTFEALGRDGIARGYHEAVGQKILAEFGEKAGGRITPEDLSKMKAHFREPHLVPLTGAKLFTNPAPSWGGRLIGFLIALFDELQVAKSPRGSEERFIKVAAAFRALSEVRAEDSDFVDATDAEERLQKRAHTILHHHQDASDQKEKKLPGNTTHLSVIDETGTACGITLTYGEGNGYEIPGTGLLMNNLMGEDDLFPDGFDSFVPGQRLRTMMAPSILVGDKGTVGVIGAGGANRIRTAMAQVILGLVVDGLSPQEAVEQGRIHLEDGVLSVERFNQAGSNQTLLAIESMALRTNHFDEMGLFFGGVHVAQRAPDGSFAGGGDPRRGGTVRVV
jgi:gamma-glutamyltranspeptidase/glutathione hydrolase